MLVVLLDSVSRRSGAVTDPGWWAAAQKGGPPVPGLRAGGDVLRRHDGRSSGAGCCFHSLIRVLSKVCRRRGGAAAQPWRCLWRRFSQITMTRPLRRITLHLSQIFLTLGLTFIELSMEVVATHRSGSRSAVDGWGVHSAPPGKARRPYL